MGAGMAQHQADTVRVTAEQRESLEKLVRCRRSEQRLVTRAQIILNGADGVGIRDTARKLGISRAMVRRWRKRWQHSRAEQAPLERLADEPRCGGPTTFSPEQICAIVALACKKPQELGLPFTHWTQQILAEQAMHDGIVEEISQRSVGRFLKRNGPQASSGAAVADH